ncbi:hypothetical protein G6F37_011656 [Rhizopus arrhizus]|nr:hypothetical protein G6F38_011524 [Rhizopus arrhizus]KAG1148152.1 hypothetical protein G6F37_011656 [Rhizopus arrhizus]
MSTFVYENGLGNFVEENGEEAIITEMDVDDETYPLDSVTNYDQYIDLKPPEKQVIKKEKVERAVHEKGLKVAQASRKLDMPTRTTQGWYDRDQKDPQDIIQRKTVKNHVERPPPLGEEHRIEADMDYLSSYIFIDEAAFHINMIKTVAWSKISSRAEVVIPKTRPKTTTILGAISPYGAINVKVRKPRAVNQIKKRKAEGGKAVINTQSRGGTVTGHYFNFICDTIDVLDKHEELKDCCIVMNNTPIHKNADIEKEVNRWGYGCVYLSPYSLELNPIEQFWSVLFF